MQSDQRWMHLQSQRECQSPRWNHQAWVHHHQGLHVYHPLPTNIWKRRICLTVSQCRIPQWDCPHPPVRQEHPCRARWRGESSVVGGDYSDDDEDERACMHFRSMRYGHGVGMSIWRTETWSWLWTAYLAWLAYWQANGKWCHFHGAYSCKRELNIITVTSKLNWIIWCPQFARRCSLWCCPRRHTQQILPRLYPNIAVSATIWFHWLKTSVGWEIGESKVAAAGDRKESYRHGLLYPR